MNDVDRRRVERVLLSQPIFGRLGNDAVAITELGLLGARIESTRAMPVGSETILVLEIDGEPAIRCRIARCDLQATLSELRGEILYGIGVEFLETTGDAGSRIRRIITEEVSRSLDQQKANARGEHRSWSEVSIGSARSGPGEPQGYICCRMIRKGEWQRSTILKPVTPSVGFTVRASTAPEEIDMLCQLFEVGDPEQRRLIRLCSVLSILDEDDTVPPPQFRD